MNADTRDMLIATVAPDALPRAERLEYALRLLRCGYTPCDARRQVRRQFDISRMTAWRIVDMALDMA